MSTDEPPDEPLPATDVVAEKVGNDPPPLSSTNDPPEATDVVAEQPGDDPPPRVSADEPPEATDVVAEQVSIRYSLWDGKAPLEGTTVEIVVDEDVEELITLRKLRERLEDETLGEGTVKLVIKDSDITIIGEETLEECKALVSVDLTGCPKLTTIGNSAFYECSAMTSVVFNNALTTIGDNAFQSCVVTNVVFNDALTTIGDYAFYNCSALTNVVFNDALTIIGYQAFYNALASVVFNEALTTIVLRLHRPDLCCPPRCHYYYSVHV